LSFTIAQRPDTTAGEFRVSGKRKATSALFRPLAPRRRRRSAPAAEDNLLLLAIWDVVCAIPRGRVSTYGAVARAAGLPGRARQAGFALKVAPEGRNLPWHRVVAAGGRIAFPASSRSHREQARRLRAEGVPVRVGRVPRALLIDLAEL
jgi:methylated-DNA-protein-cysteine methyltransferase-like protein